MMTPEVAQAVEELRADYPDASVVLREDGQGGVFVTMEDVPTGSTYVQASSWVGFQITFQYPVADTYPHFFRGDLARRDGGALREGLAAGQQFEGRQAVQASRRSLHLDPTMETASLKLGRVLRWLQESA